MGLEFVQGEEGIDVTSDEIVVHGRNRGRSVEFHIVRPTLEDAWSQRGGPTIDSEHGRQALEEACERAFRAKGAPDDCPVFVVSAVDLADDRALERPEYDGNGADQR